ncbi:MAG: histidine kinase dimerization/phospho-acceptor domain-containing protein [bacterium]
MLESQQKAFRTDIRLSKSVNQEFLYVAMMISVQPTLHLKAEGPAFIRISVNLQEIHKMLYEIRFKIVVAALAVFLIIIFVSRFIGRTITEPINEISRIVKDIKAGNYDQKLPVKSNDEFGQLAGMINQITDTIKADIEQMRKLELVWTEFLGNVSHELRTPIFSLKGFLETLLDGAIDDKAVNRKFVEKAYHPAARLDTLLTDLIEISKAIDSFVNNDPDLAKTILLEDDFIDNLDKQNFNLMLQRMNEASDNITPAAHIMILLRDSERLVDHATNIVEDVVFLDNARIIKHHSDDPALI